MEESKEKFEGYENTDQEKIFSKAVRAGKRTYFFDVKVTKSDDYYVTITESKKRYQNDGRYFYEKHKIFLFKEDFEKFMEGLEDATDFIQSAGAYVRAEASTESKTSQDYSNIEFEDLEKVDAIISEGDKE
jgi:Protein of unknown function (DUF3276)